jgi:hypothetical protein
MRVDYDAHRRELLAWLIENQLDPNIIPAGSSITVTRSTITVEVFANTGGKLIFDPNRGHVPTTEITVPMLTTWEDRERFDG